MMLRRVLLPFSLGLCAGLALWALWPQTPPARGPDVTCRPSGPQTALAGAERPVLLLWGNSLLFDHDWTNGPYLPVNCAQQGQTLSAALPRTPALPQMPVDVILLAFGSVELIRPDPIDMDTFRTELDQMLHLLRARYPQARIVLAGVPFGGPASDPWVYQDRRELNAINQALITENRAGFLDLSALLDAAGEAAQHYDGVHLTHESYRIWEAALARLAP